MGKKLLSGFISLIFIGAGASSALALQSGGVEVGDLETGSVIGQKFSQMDVDAEFTAMEVGAPRNSGIRRRTLLIWSTVAASRCC